jgi:hypothetical protein
MWALTPALLDFSEYYHFFRMRPHRGSRRPIRVRGASKLNDNVIDLAALHDEANPRFQKSAVL